MDSPSTTGSLTQKWLRQQAHPYPDRDRVYADIDAALTRFTTLRPKSDVYTFDDGRTQLLLCVHGLLPISFRQASYHIPVAIWFIREYPRQPPIVYVVPTNDMLVKAGKYIDVSGRCTLEYMTLWKRKSESCNLSALLEAMQEQFSREPPVYAKPTQTPSPNVEPTPSSDPNLHVNYDRPALPPRPGASPQSPVLIAVTPSPSSGPSNVPSHVSMRPPLDPPRPPPPPSHSPHRPPMYRNSPEPPVYRVQTPPSQVVIPSSSRAPVVATQRWSTPAFHTGHGRPQIPAGITRLSPAPMPTAAVLTQPPNVNQPFVYASGPLHPLDSVQIISSPTPKPAQPVPNLLEEETNESTSSALVQPQIAAPVPPRPLNPELLSLHARVHAKISADLASVTKALALDGERLRANQTDLLAGEPAIRDEMARLEAVKDVCRSVVTRMRANVEQAERNIAELRRKGDPEVDELVCSTTIVHNQLINLVAEDNAIEDTIYHLHRALNTGRIDLERFLRTTRVLAEEQFMKRALIEKIQASLPIGSHWT